MHYRRADRMDLDYSVLGIGAMRYSDADNAFEVIQAAVGAGCNYIDTCPGYGHQSDTENSEVWVGKAIKGHRSKLLLSSKGAQPNPNGPTPDLARGFNLSSADEARQLIDQSLRRLDVDYLDFYQFWSCSAPETFERLTAKDGFLDGMKAARDEGLIRHIGITSHDKPENIIRYLETGEFGTVTIVYNVIRRENEPVIRRAAELGIAVCTMCSLSGGVLAGASDRIRALLPQRDWTAPELALRYVLDTAGVTCALSGMTRVSDVEQNVRTALAPPLSPAERAALLAGIDKSLGQAHAICTGCAYCMPCPEGIDIPAILRAYTMGRFLGLESASRAAYARGLARDDNAWRVDVCAECGQCTEKCPNEHDVPAHLKEADQYLAGL